MKKIGKILSKITIIFILFYHPYALTQDLQFISKASKYRVSRFEEIELTFSINGHGTSFIEPKNLRDHFTIVSGPSNRMSTRFDGSGLYVETSVSYIVMPKKAGTFIIDEASITVSGKTYKSKPMHIEVSSAPIEENPDPNDPKNIAKKLAFVKVRLSKNVFYVGEGFTVDYLLYYKTNVMNIEILNEPSFSGFYAELIKDEVSPSQELVNGEYYNVVTLKRYVIFGQKPGKFNPEPLEVRIPTEIPTANRDFFNPFYRPSTIVNQVSVFTVPSITVKSLPEYSGQYEYSGAVGSFDFKAKLTKTEVNAGDAVSLHMTAEGTGNIRMITFPKLEFPMQFDVFEPKYSEKYSVSNKGMSGSKSVEYIIIPQYNGTYKIPKIAFVYFDPSTSKYVEKIYDNFQISVSGGQPFTSRINESSQSGSKTNASTSYLNRDILFIKTTSNWITDSRYYINSFIIYIWSLFAILIFLTVFVYTRYGSKIFLSIRKRYEFKKSIKNLIKYINNDTSDTKEKLRYLNKNVQALLNEFYSIKSVNMIKSSNDLADTHFYNYTDNLISIIRDTESAIFSFKNENELKEILERYKNLLLLISK